MTVRAPPGAGTDPAPGPQRRFVAGGTLAALLPALLGGCAKPPPGFDAALFPRSDVPAARRLPAQAALVPPPPTVPESMTLALARHPGSAPGSALVLPLRRIVEEALILALAEVLQGAAVRVDGPPAPEAGYAGTLQLRALRLAGFPSAHLRAAPVPPFVALVPALDAELGFDLAWHDREGRRAWQRAFDLPRERWLEPRLLQPKDDPPPLNLIRHAHTSAWRLAREAAAAVAESIAAERRQPRAL